MNFNKVNVQPMKSIKEYIFINDIMFVQCLLQT